MLKLPLLIPEKIERMISQIANLSPAHKIIPLNTENNNFLAKSVYWTLAIEGNCLDEKKVASIMNGNLVISSPRDLREAQNAIKAYGQINTLNPVLESDLKIAHGLFMNGLLFDSGKYRLGSVGIYSDSKLIYKAPEAEVAPKLMAELFKLMEDSSDCRPLVMSSLFHYHFLWILPFSGGNGQIGRFWQKLILSKWHPAFLYLPFEELIFEDLEGYHKAIKESHNTNDPISFVNYMLKILSRTVEKYL
ncbi:Fic family protein [Thorsellia anophelis]|uniref:Fic family protein n=1 Tax=Thorsellia anophelis DSM 18579 TaxID=1123402 RepID=A0A1I0C3C6_9GAMM|nr:Fic family protein [Thorsellia anophelis]SET13969.1 Fic family protein [Thorsellia anophelis DSM 18579]